MTTTDLLTDLTAAGLSVRLSDTPMEYRILVSPPSLITPRLRAMLTAHRDDLVTALYGASIDALWPPMGQSSLAALTARLAATSGAVNGELRVVA